MAGQFLAEISKKEQLTQDIFRLTLPVPEVAAAARPGQFVMVRSGKNLDPLLNRPFSLHQGMDDGRIQILFKVLGEGTRRLARQEVGDQITLIGPLGRGFSLPEPASRPCLVGGGMGIAPLFFLARELLRRHPAQVPELLLGARTAVEVRQLAAEFRLMGLDPLVATDDGTLGYKGLVTDLWPRLAESAQPRQVFCCGPHPMMAAVARHCAAENWPCQVSLETMMACGVAACLGCAIKGKQTAVSGDYLHVCKHGPVFEAQTIDWS